MGAENKDRKRKKNRHKSRTVGQLLCYVFLTALAVVMVYPLLWMIGSSFKENNEIITSLSIFPKQIRLSAFVEGWKGNGRYTYLTYFVNTFLLVVPTVFFTVFSSMLVAYGFARFHFPLKKLCFALVISTLLLPEQTLMVPRYLLFNRLGWLDSYKPVIVPAIFATYPFFIYMMIQFIRGLPRELDESARIDGCGSFGIFAGIIVPLSKPAIFSVTLFQFVWRWNDFFNPLIYINSVSKYPVSLALRMSLDVADTVHWDQLMAMSLLTMLPPVLLYIFAQKYFIEGIATSGLKG
ncbi:carbohydrate ABC transporter permease [Acetatifactor muris]|uniref:carbohydrate ABC transporter permease n=1 Tax=Acetatifactor muris TaxID=879566 RepID=UPI002ED033C5